MAENIDPNIIEQLNRGLEDLTETSEGMGTSFKQTTTTSDYLTVSFKNLNAAIKKASDDMDRQTRGAGTAIERIRAREEKAREEELKKEAEARDKDLKEKKEAREADLKANRDAREIKRKADAEDAKRLADKKESDAKAKEAEDKKIASILNANSQFQSLDGAVDGSMNMLTELSGKGAVATIGFQALGTVLKGTIELFQSLYNAQITYDKAVIAGARGQEVVARRTEEMGKAFNKLIDTVGSVIMGFGGALIALAPFTGGLTAVAGAAVLAAGGAMKLYAAVDNTALEFNTLNAQLKDKLFAGFNELGKASMTSAGGMTGLKDQLNELMLGMADVAEFTNLVKNAGKEIKMFGVSTSEGLQEFVRTAGGLVKSELGKTLETMGITAQDQREHMIAFLAQEARLGKQRITDQDKLNKAAYNYILEMDKLAELTGATRKEQEEARNQIMAIEELRAAQLAATDPEEKAMLDRALKNAELLYASGAKGLAAGVAKYFAAGGAVTSAEAARAQMATPQLLEDIRKGNTTVAQNMVNVSSELKLYATNIAGIGRLNAEATKKILPDTYAAITDLAKKVGGVDQEKLAKMTGEELDAWLENLRKTNDPLVKQQVELIRAQREEAMKRENATFTFKTAVETFRDAVGNFTGRKDRDQISPKPFPTSVKSAEKGREEAAKVQEAADKKVLAIQDEIKATENALKQKNLSAEDDKKLTSQYKKLKEDLIQAEIQANKAMHEANSRQAELNRLKQEQIKAQKALPALEKELKDKEKTLQDMRSLDAKKRNIEKEVEVSTQIEQQKKKIAQTRRAAEGEAPLGAGAGRTRASEAELAKDPLAGLDFGGKKGERTGGGKVDPGLIELAHKINGEFEGVTITAMNDLYHKESKTSKHPKGKALDFTMGRPPKDASEADAIVEQLKQMGASSVRDEYFRQKNANTTGPHFHVEIAHDGGYFKSNLGEFPVILKSGEYVLTSKMVQNLRTKFDAGVSKTPIDRVFPEATSMTPTRAKDDVNDLVSSFVRSQKRITEQMEMTSAPILRTTVEIDRIVNSLRNQLENTPTTSTKTNEAGSLLTSIIDSQKATTNDINKIISSLAETQKIMTKQMEVKSPSSASNVQNKIDFASVKPKIETSFPESIGTKPTEFKYDMGNILTTFIKSQETPEKKIEAKSEPISKPGIEIDTLVNAVVSSNEALKDKLDAMIDVLETGVSLQDKLLKYSRN